MDMLITPPGGAQVDASFGPFTVQTDQPPRGGGTGSAPTPFALFLASIGTCAGIYVRGFLKQRGLATEGVKIVQRTHREPSNGQVGQIDLEIQTPPDFPAKYQDALIRSVELCAVKKHMETSPNFSISCVTQ